MPLDQVHIDAKYIGAGMLISTDYDMILSIDKNVSELLLPSTKARGLALS
jgi:hypothetical protein